MPPSAAFSVLTGMVCSVTSGTTGSLPSPFGGAVLADDTAVRSLPTWAFHSRRASSTSAVFLRYLRLVDAGELHAAFASRGGWADAHALC